MLTSQVLTTQHCQLHLEISGIVGLIINFLKKQVFLLLNWNVVQSHLTVLELPKISNKGDLCNVYSITEQHKGKRDYCHFPSEIQAWKYFRGTKHVIEATNRIFQERILQKFKAHPLCHIPPLFGNSASGCP